MIYLRQCLDCFDTFDVICKMSEKDTIKPSCPVCSSTNGAWRPTSPNLSCSLGFSHPAEKTGLDRVLKGIDKTYGTNSYKG